MREPNGKSRLEARSAAAISFGLHDALAEDGSNFYTQRYAMDSSVSASRKGRSVIERPRGRSSWIGPVALLASFFVLTLVWTARFETTRFRDPDAYDYAQMGREIAEGRGFATIQVFPRHVSFLDEQGLLTRESWPNLYRYPLPTLANAALCVVFSDPLKSAVVQSGLCFLVSIPVLLIVGRRLAGGILATAGVAAWLATPLVWTSSYSGLSEPLVTLIVLLAVSTSLSSMPPRTKAGLGGLLCGFAFLTRSQWLTLFPFLLVLQLVLAARRYRRSVAASLLAGFLITVAPWSTRNILLTGDPFFSFSTSRNLVLDTGEVVTDLDLQLHAPVTTASVLQTHGNAVVRKVVGHLVPELFNPLAWTGSIFHGILVCVILAVSLSVPRRATPPEYEIFKWWLVSLLIANFVVVSLAFPERRFYTPLYPLLPLVAFRELLIAAGSLPRKFRRAGSVLPGVLLAFFATKAFYAVTTPLPDPARQQRDVARSYAIREKTGGDGIVASNFSHVIALHARMRTLRLPTEPIELLEISEKYITIDHVAVDRRIIDGTRHGSGRFEDYRRYTDFIRSDEFLSRYVIVAELPNGGLLFRRVAENPPNVFDPGRSPESPDQVPGVAGPEAAASRSTVQYESKTAKALPGWAAT